METLMEKLIPVALGDFEFEKQFKNEIKGIFSPFLPNKVPS